MSDFNDDGIYDCDDVDSLVSEIVAGSHNLAFDLTGDGLVNTDDLDAWRTEAGAVLFASGNPVLEGDANLDGLVDGFDFLAWNTNKFSGNPSWCRGDFNADGQIEGLDFLLWNANKFLSSDRLAGPGGLVDHNPVSDKVGSIGDDAVRVVRSKVAAVSGDEGRWSLPLTRRPLPPVNDGRLPRENGDARTDREPSVIPMDAIFASEELFG